MEFSFNQKLTLPLFKIETKAGSEEEEKDQVYFIKPFKDSTCKS